MAAIDSIKVGDTTYTIGGWGEPGITGYTPIGTIIAIMGNTAPPNYLACDNSIYNIVDYPELADYFEDQFGSKNNFGGDGETTFAVPDLRGEFLRGTGTSPTYTYSSGGAAVGVHQTPTTLPFWNTGYNTASSGTKHSITIGFRSDITNGTYVSYTYPDGTITSAGYRKFGSFYSDAIGTSTTSKIYMFTTRPTNTSVLFCIATKNIYTNPENSYSTDEKAVGRWVDGSLIYQKTFITTNIPNNNQVIISHEIENLGIAIQVSGMLKAKSGYFTPLPRIQDNVTTANIGVDISSSSVIIKSRTFDAASIFDTAYITIQYTKTSVEPEETSE